MAVVRGAMSLPMFDDHLEVPRPNPQEIPDGSRPVSGDSPATVPTHFSPSASGAADDFDLYLLALGKVRGVGLQALRALIDYFDHPRQVWAEDIPAVHDVLARARIKDSDRIAGTIFSQRDELIAAAERERQALRKRGIRVISQDSPEFPATLLELPDTPKWLFVQGDASVLSGPLIAIVGTRTASSIGVRATKRLTRFVVEQGIGVVSGLAEGIDAAAHSMAVFFGARQIAVLGTGINSTFPSSTAKFREPILATGGAIITEYLPDTRYERAHFVHRDRLQAALAAAVCPVEGRLSGGTAHTVRFAEKLKRTLFAVRLGQPHPDNELVSFIGERGGPIFDLITDEGVAALRALLADVPGERWPVTMEPDPEKIFAEALRALDEVRNVVPMTEKLARWYLERAERKLRPPKRQ